ncbi:YdeI/OmpD-associated family protein [Jiangella anatolica]|uniref:2-isopropylmalate synthase n=1 Tax=Jiangella anatolica TaxID=2670374 RepID=A0A2W2CDC4_9ACTN|nr:YdeI/OmpD-associated family protein [Jiangella anatolica]PZF86219.1 2-isopropylmalate synthase [Jiangella anatolica]
MATEFDAVLVGDDGPGCGFALPFDPKEAYGKARAPVLVSVNGEPPFRTTVAVYGGAGWIGLRKALRADLGVDVGDTVHVAITPDDQPRVVDVPPELSAALAADPAAQAAYEAMSFSHRREYADWIAEAKRQQTRDDRAAKAVRMILGDEAP